MQPVENPATSLVTKAGQSIPLQGVRAKGRLEGLVFTLEVEQHYRNPFAESVEAVYTFPLPSRAVLLGLELEVGGQTLTAIATAKAEAKRRYEQAIDDGDTTVLLEHNGHGLYTVSLGHLRAGESATIRYRYVELLDAFEGHVRLAIPTVIAPRYGNPGAAGLEGPAIPATSFLAEYPFDIEILLAGLRAESGLRSPSHAIDATPVPDGLRVALQRQGFLDQDFVLQLQAAALPQRALVARDGAEWVVLASPAYATATPANGPFTVKVLLDCSGSMSGERIESAKSALTLFLRGLSVEDRFSLTCFGTHHQHLTPGLETLDEAVRAALLLRVRDIRADLGGTNIAEALQATLGVRAPRGTDILLITDGEVHDVQGSLQAVAHAGHRLFVVAIGAAPNEALATALATQTGGAVEFVRDEQDARDAILRMFKRLRTPATEVGAVDWAGARPAWALPAVRQLFNGDTLHVAAGFTARPTGAVRVTVGKDVLSCTIPMDDVPGDWLPRLLAARRLPSLAPSEAQALAVRHNLVSEHTSLVVVAKREDGQKPENLPRTVAVPQMAVAENRRILSAPSMVCYSMSKSASTVGDFAAPLPRLSSKPRESAPAFLRPLAHKLGAPPRRRKVGIGGNDGAKLLDEHFLRQAAGQTGLETFADLAAAGASPEVLAQLEAVADQGHPEKDVVVAFLAWLVTQFSTAAAEADVLRLKVRAHVATRRFRELRSAMKSGFKAA